MIAFKEVPPSSKDLKVSSLGLVTSTLGKDSEPVPSGFLPVLDNRTDATPAPPPKTIEPIAAIPTEYILISS